jgi:hypothetical protein
MEDADFLDILSPSAVLSSLSVLLVSNLVGTGSDLIYHTLCLRDGPNAGFHVC